MARFLWPPEYCQRRVAMGQHYSWFVAAVLQNGGMWKPQPLAESTTGLATLGSFGACHCNAGDWTSGNKYWMWRTSCSRDTRRLYGVENTRRETHGTKIHQGLLNKAWLRMVLTCICPEHILGKLCGKNANTINIGPGDPAPLKGSMRGSWALSWGCCIAANHLGLREMPERVDVISGGPWKSALTRKLVYNFHSTFEP